jgi:hypothetical protein
MTFEVIMTIIGFVVAGILYTIYSLMEKILKRLSELNDHGKTCEKLLESVNDNVRDIQYYTMNMYNIAEAICVDDSMNEGEPKLHDVFPWIADIHEAICANSDDPMDEPKLHAVFHWIEEIHRMLSETCEERKHIKTEQPEK